MVDLPRNLLSLPPSPKSIPEVLTAPKLHQLWQQPPSEVKGAGAEEISVVSVTTEAAADPHEADKIIPTKTKIKIETKTKLKLPPMPNPIKRAPDTLMGLQIRPALAIGRLEGGRLTAPIP